ncbi:hypothetical protein HRbin32_01570 [bacterium HR32]|nr:hypothetical protein HRbin32_01570 [bacterium HR32]
MVRGVDLCLDCEQVHGVPEVCGQGWGQIRHGPEQTWEHALVDPHHGVRGVKDVEADTPVVGVHHRLHRVPDVVGGSCGLRVRVAVAGGVGVHDPEQPTLRHHHVRVPVVAQEGSEPPHPVGDGPVEQDTAVGREVCGQEDPRLPEPGGERQAPEPAVQRDATLSAVAGGDVLVPARVVELRDPGADDGVIAGELSEVDLGPVHPQLGDLRPRREVPQPQLRQPLLGHAVDGRGHHAVAVRVHQVAVHPGPGLWGQPVQVQLPRGQHQLLLSTTDPVAVDVHVREHVVGAQSLQLPVRFQEGPVVPQADVFQRVPVPRQSCGVQPLRGLEGHSPDAVEAVGPQGGLDVHAQVRGLAAEFRGRHNELLHQGGHQADPQEPRRGREHEHAGCEPQGAQPGVGEQQAGTHQRQGREDVQGRKPRVGVRVGDAEHEPPLRGQELVGVQSEAAGPHQQQKAGQQRQVRAGAGAESPGAGACAQQVQR